MRLQHIVDAVGSRLDGSPLLIMLDVDGTLAPIAPTPEQAAIPDATADVLHRLASLPDVTVAFVSGRAAHDTLRMTGVPGAWIAGNHGAELRAPSGEIVVDANVMRFASVIAQAARRLEHELSDVHGALVEDKRWTLSVHYRLVAEAEVARLVACAERVGRELGLRPMDGKKIVELRPPVEVNKGTAVATLLQQLKLLPDRAAALYAGDDRTDEDAFAALRSAFPAAVTIRIDHDNAPSDTRAEFRIEATDTLRELLEWLTRRREAPPS